MATLATTVLTPITLTTTGGTAGQAAGWAAATATVGDLIPVTGKGTILRVKTSGTGCTATIENVVLSNYGGDQDIVLTLSSTDEQEVYIANDGRFDQGSSNRGYAKVTCSVVTGVSIAAKVVPG